MWRTWSYIVQTFHLWQTLIRPPLLFLFPNAVSLGVSSQPIQRFRCGLRYGFRAGSGGSEVAVRVPMWFWVVARWFWKFRCRFWDGSGWAWKFGCSFRGGSGGFRGSRVGPGAGEKILKRYIHRSFLNSNYSSITSQKLFANKNIKDYHILPHSFHKITSTNHFHYLIHFSKSSVPTISLSLPHSFSQNHHSQFITPSFIFTKSSQLIMSSSRSFH